MVTHSRRPNAAGRVHCSGKLAGRWRDAGGHRPLVRRNGPTSDRPASVRRMPDRLARGASRGARPGRPSGDRRRLGPVGSASPRRPRRHENSRQAAQGRRPRRARYRHNGQHPGRPPAHSDPPRSPPAPHRAERSAKQPPPRGRLITRAKHIRRGREFCDLGAGCHSELAKAVPQTVSGMLARVVCRPNVPAVQRRDASTCRSRDSRILR